VDDNPDVDMIPAELHSRHSSMSDHYSVPPTTDSDHDIAIPDNEDSEPEADQRNRRQPSSKLNSSTQSVCGNLNVHYYDLNLLCFLSDFSSTSESFSC
jgi:hypothetical protein